MQKEAWNIMAEAEHSANEYNRIFYNKNETLNKQVKVISSDPSNKSFDEIFNSGGGIPMTQKEFEELQDNETLDI